MKLRIIAGLVTISIFMSSVSVLAQESINQFSDFMSSSTDDVISTTEPEPTPFTQSETYYDAEETVSDESPKPEENIHTETLPDNIEISDEEFDLRGMTLPNPYDASMFSATNSFDDMWKSVFTDQFGDDYLKPYAKKEGGQQISGNTNRLIVEETDLFLPGKNGLNLELKRRHDNQDYNEIYSAVMESNDTTIRQHKYMVTFKNTSTNKRINIAFYTEDDFYAYMYDGARLKEINTDKLQTIKRNGVNYSFYNFSYIKDLMTDDVSCDFYEYDNTVDCMEFYQEYDDGYYSLTSRKILNNRNSLGNNWNLLIPEAYMYQYSRYSETSAEGLNSEYKTYYGEYVGAFRDLEGNVYSFDGNDEYTKYKNTDFHSNEYTSNFYCDDNKSLSITKYFTALELDDGTVYNFTIRDSRGYTYYLYNPEAQEIEKPKQKQSNIIVAVEDDYGNRISYIYNSNSTNVNKIIDTYGREINITYGDNNTVISYYDDIEGETKSITYETSILPGEDLKNDSCIEPKEVKRFTVTNQQGEKTIYDSRDTKVINVYGTFTTITGYPSAGYDWAEFSTSNNIERIIYPTGAETRYGYQCIYPYNKETKITRGVYAVTSSYDIVDGVEVNRNDYSFTNDGREINVTRINAVSNQKTVSEYNEDGLLTNMVTNSTESSYPRNSVTYTYDGENKPKRISVTNNGLTNTTNYKYESLYPDRISEEYNDKKKVIYTYHSSGKPKTIKYQYEDAGRYVTDYIVSTTLTADSKSIEYERVTKDNVIQSQTKYEYDTEGNVIAVKQWTSDSNGDGILDENDNFTTLSTTYTNTALKTTDVTNTVTDVLNADGVNEGNVTTDYKLNIYGSPIYQKDSYGTVTTIEYDALNRPVKYNMPNGSEKTIEYNSEESYTIVTDESGIKTKNVYDGLGRITEKYRLYGNSSDLLESYVYDNAGRISEKRYGQSGSSKVKEVYTYDALDRLLTKKVYENTWTLLYTENYTYSSGKITVATTAADGTVTANKITTYDKYGNIIKTEAVSGETTISSTSEYDYLDREVKVTDANGNSTIYEYNCNGQAVKVTDALGNEVETVYDLAGQAVSVTDAKGNTTVTDYDKLGRAVKVTAPFDGTQNAITKTYYDKNSNVVKTSVRKNGPLYTTSENKYDNMGNLIASISGEGEETSVVQYSYDNANRMTKMITGLAEYSENPVGGNVTTYEYGTNGFLSKVTDPMGKSEEYYSYDEYGNVTGKYDKNGEVFFYTYGAYGLKKETIWAYGEKEYTYNSIGQLIKTTDKYSDRDDIIETYTYDVFGRMISTTANDGTVQNYTYDNNSNVLTYNMQKGENEQNNIVYEYDSLNRLTKLTNNDNIFTYIYDKNSNLTDVIDAANANIDTHISYNSANLPVTYRNRYGGKNFSYNMTYDLLGQKKTETDTANNISREYYYTSLGQLSMEEKTQDGTAVSIDYCYDKNGNRIQINEYVQATNAHNVTDYTYDANNRMTSITNTVSNEVTDTTRFYYDDNGNTIAEQNKIYSSGTENSKMLLSGRSGGGTMKVYEYDKFNRLVKYNDGGTEASYTYNANNLRQSKTVNGSKTSFVWNGQNLAGETKNGTTTSYTYDSTGIILSDNGIDTTRYIKDPHGNVVATSRNNTIIGEYDYTAFGNQTECTDTSNPFRYCGEYYDYENNMVYLRNRYYNSTTGRFITEDPAKDGLNWYVYCAGNPVMYNDPTGEAFGVTARDARDITTRFGLSIAWEVNTASDRARNNAVNKADTWGYYDDYGNLITWDNRADAMRHFQWNAIMAREIGIDVAKYVGDRHEINGAKDAGLFREERNGIVRMRVGQATLMDLWNNSVGRTLANDTDLSYKNYDELFYYAEANNLLILNAEDAFDFYGINDYVDWDTWTVGVEYNMGAETLKIMKDGLPDIIVKVGIESWW